MGILWTVGPGQENRQSIHSIALQGETEYTTGTDAGQGVDEGVGASEVFYFLSEITKSSFQPQEGIRWHKLQSRW